MKRKKQLTLLSWIWVNTFGGVGGDALPTWFENLISTISKKRNSSKKCYQIKIRVQVNVIKKKNSKSFFSSPKFDLIFFPSKREYCDIIFPF